MITFQPIAIHRDAPYDDSPLRAIVASLRAMAPHTAGYDHRQCSCCRLMYKPRNVDGHDCPECTSNIPRSLRLSPRKERYDPRRQARIGAGRKTG